MKRILGLGAVLPILVIAMTRITLGSTPVFDYSSFSLGVELGWQGSARLANSTAQLTPSATNVAGAIWYPVKRRLAAGFEANFSFRISGPGNGGLAFVLQGEQLPSLGTAGGGLGYQGIRNGVVVEFDTGSNIPEGGTDTEGPHISLHAGGVGANISASDSAAIGPIAAAPAIADGNVHRVRILWAADVIEVYLDENPALLSVPLALLPAVEWDLGQAWFGFTAATGSEPATQEILSWSMAVSEEPLEVHLSAPLEGASAVAPARFDLVADITPPAARIAQVEFFQGGQRIGETTNAPYQAAWTNVSPGAYTIIAVAHPEEGAPIPSAPIRLVVYSADPPIGIHFATGSNGVHRTLPVTGQAGALPQRYWNDAILLPGGNNGVRDARNGLGLSTTLDMNYDFFAPSESPSVNEGLSWNHTLMKTFGLDQSGSGVGQSNSTINISQVPFPVYDVIVYSDGDNGQADRVAQFRIGGTSIYLRDAAGNTFPGIFVRGGSLTDLGSATSAGNYVRFDGITSNSFNLVVTARSTSDGTPRAAVSAIQIVPSVFDTSVPPRVTRGPYLQSGTPRSIIVRWRTNRPVESRVRIGSAPDALDEIFDDPLETTEHTVLVTNLSANSRYYYSIGTITTNLVADTNQFFWTTPIAGRPTRVWALGDQGTANTNAAAVRDAYLRLAGNRYTDVWLMLGDNAYNSGTDGEFQAAVFNFHTNTLRQSVLWSVIGNHETAQSHNPSLTIPYFQIHNFPTNGEAGGIPSGTEKYYSFDYGNIHFVCLDAMTSARKKPSAMLDWLEADLEANTNLWLIALFHHPPYTKGSHDSDDPHDADASQGVDFELVEMRENVVPILESYGVDLVLSGHSHCYERSFLLYGHYGYSTNLTEEMILNASSGRPEDTGPYIKPTTGPTAQRGTVYIVAGSSGQATFGSLDHPAMFVSYLNLGSLVLDIETNRLDARFVRDTGAIDDSFTLIKETAASRGSPLVITSVDRSNRNVTLTWLSEPGRTYSILRAPDVNSTTWELLAERIPATGTRTSWSHLSNGEASAGFYRVVTSGN